MPISKSIAAQISEFRVLRPTWGCLRAWRGGFDAVFHHGFTGHDSFNDRTGLAREARLAGHQMAETPATPIRTLVPISVAGSNGSTANS